jgi:hypothetical protein
VKVAIQKIVMRTSEDHFDIECILEKRSPFSIGRDVFTGEVRDQIRIPITSTL